MGTDIHAAIEWRDANGWHAKIFDNPYPDNEDDKLTAQVPFPRSYRAFAILADVRNGSGFAGVKTGYGYGSISSGRGLPSDISEEAKNTGCTGDHSATWVSLRELLETDWTQRTTNCGYVSPKWFSIWDEYKEEPHEHCGDCWGPNIRKLTNGQMRAYCRDTPRVEWDERGMVTQVEWTNTYAEDGIRIWTHLLPHMLNLARDHGIDNVRLVMNFDS